VLGAIQSNLNQEGAAHRYLKLRASVGKSASFLKAGDADF